MREYEKGFYAPTKGRYTHEYVPRINRDMADKTLLPVSENLNAGFGSSNKRECQQQI